MDSCNGTTHSWSDDSYSQGSYPCPGPDKCPDAKARLEKLAEEAGATITITPESLKEIFGYDEEAEVADRQRRLEALAAEVDARKARERLEAVERLEEQKAALVSKRGVEAVVKATTSDPSATQELIAEVCDGIRDFLLDKNAQYGDSAIDPVRIFSKASPIEQLLVRIDDKLSRIEKGDDRIESDDDVIDDLIGYFILLKVAKRKGLS